MPTSTIEETTVNLMFILANGKRIEIGCDTKKEAKELVKKMKAGDFLIIEEQK